MKNKILNIILSILIISEPILEILWIKDGSILSIGSFTISTIIRYLLSFFVFIIVILKWKQLKLKNKFVIYICISLIYLFFHIINSNFFTSYVPGNFNFNIFEEIYYYIRMIIPILMILIVYNTADNFDKYLKNSIIITSIFMILIYFITNLSCTSISSYSDIKISANIFSWFLEKSNYSYVMMTTRGIFYSVIISYLFLLFIPYLIYLFANSTKKSKSLLYALLIFCCMICLFMVGTKATTFGFILCYFTTVLTYLFFVFIKKQYKFSLFKLICIVVILVSSLMILPYSPCMKKIKDENIITAEIINDDNAIVYDKTINNDDIIEDDKTINNDNIIKNNAIINKNKYENDIFYRVVVDVLGESFANQSGENFNFDEIYNNANDSVKRDLYVKYFDYTYEKQDITVTLIKDSYSYKFDPLFWKDFIENTPIEQRPNNRLVQQAIFDRIKSINHNYFDNLFGITYSRTSKVFNLERDFIYQFYSIGIFGVIIFLMPYIICILFAIIHMLLNYKNKFNFLNCTLIIGIGVILCISYYSGNTLENLGITIPLGIMCGYLVKKVI